MVLDLSVAPFQNRGWYAKIQIDLVVYDYLFPLISSKHVGSNDNKQLSIQDFFSKVHILRNN